MCKLSILALEDHWLFKSRTELRTSLEDPLVQNLAS
jgi:hypothetical protein